MRRQDRIRNQRQRRYKVIRRILKVTILIILISFLVYAGYIGSKIFLSWYKIQSLDDDFSYHDDKITKHKDYEAFTMLIMGVDNEGGQFVGRSDVLMVAVFNPNTQKISLLSIPRDTYTEIAGKGVYDKINHAYASGIKTAIKTVEKFLDIHIDYWVVVNFDGFRDFIDVLGGLEIEIERDMYYHIWAENSTIDLKKGKRMLNGEETLHYVRFRADAEGDFGRNRRQQQVIRAVLDQTLDMRTVTKVADILDVVGENVRTNTPATEILSMVKQFSSLSGDDVETISFKVDVGSIDGISYVFVDEEEQYRIQKELKQRLEPSMVTETKQSEQSQGENY
ncbi:LCP family protein required for cell wall assembly [Caldalkalibacillus uzonensis]|uniref:LCP family protein required for cell wall assembly n=1 Tax=Caldalkalibacillus uzonensis TaxID=353224 RepID=A0ABU0CUS8_9BACI|nr:LCP family protein [Caldalkalibacillus uzonensis]MDQ0339882.1 LCP family protein required for cell wall assembly [Caldalkalibacillus uzonensis]